MSKLWPTNLRYGKSGGASTFLPDEYVKHRTELRANVVSLVLFAAVMTTVVGAFLVTHRQWNDVREQHRVVTEEYDAEAQKIEQLKLLDKQRREMIEKAEVAAALLEKVPRSILFAEIINRMPDRLAITELNMQSKRIAEAPPKTQNPANQPKSLSAQTNKQQAGSKNAGGNQPPTPKPARLEFNLVITGMAATDADIADFQAALKDSELLRGVEWKETKATTVDDSNIRQFVIEATIRPNADTRNLSPILATRIKPHVVAKSPEKDDKLKTGKSASADGK